MPTPRKCALTIAGSDPSGGAGLQADLKTFHQHGVYGMAVVSLLTVQDTRCVSRVEVLSADLVAQQLEAVLEDIPPDAIKTGALGNSSVIAAVAERLKGLRCPIVVDPVMVSKHGHALLDPQARETLIDKLLPITSLLTPNAPEAQVMLGRAVTTVEDAQEAARSLAALGPQAVLVKGGHLEGEAVDVLFHQGRIEIFSGLRLDSRNTHGTGCSLSAAIAAWLAQGVPVAEAVRRAKAWLAQAIATATPRGRGVGPVNHHAPVSGLETS